MTPLHQLRAAESVALREPGEAGRPGRWSRARREGWGYEERRFPKQKKPKHQTMRTIYKFPIESIGVPFTMQVTEDAKFLAAMHQHGKGPKMWFEIDTEPNGESQDRRYVLRGTGLEFKPVDGEKHLTTFQSDDGLYVWHLYELP